MASFIHAFEEGIQDVFRIRNPDGTEGPEKSDKKNDDPAPPLIDSATLIKYATYAGLAVGGLYIVRTVLA